MIDTKMRQPVDVLKDKYLQAYEIFYSTMMPYVVEEFMVNRPRVIADMLKSGLDLNKANQLFDYLCVYRPREFHAPTFYNIIMSMAMDPSWITDFGFRRLLRGIDPWTSVRLKFASHIKQYDMPVFLFNDSREVKAVIESQVNRLPVSAINLPFSTFIIGLPEPLVYPEACDNKPVFDCIIIERGQAMIEGKRVPCWSMMCVNSKNTDEQMYNVIPLEEGLTIDDDGFRVDGKYGDMLLKPAISSDPDASSAAMMMGIKLIMFINSVQCKTTKIQRSFKKRGFTSASLKPYFNEVRVVAIDRDRFDYEYEDKHSLSTRKIECRFYVRGHFKHFTKGPISRRENPIIWCPSHFRGPELATAKRPNNYTIGKG